MSHVRVMVEEASQVAQARREAVTLATALGFDETRTGTAALAATEAATNLVKHARGGQILLGRIERGEAVGMEMYAIDSGAGIANIAASLRDGASSAGSPGLGLGTLSRIASDFEIYTQPGKGTVLHFELWNDPHPAQRPGSVAAAAICIPKGGESVSGDGWLVHEEKGRVLLLVADGLGHGPEAAAASAAARRIAWEQRGSEPGALIEAMHDALKSTRGAAAAVVRLAPATEVGTYCGIGNIACSVRAGGTSRSLVSHNGILGHQLRKLQEFSFPFPRNALLIAHSDGITTRWNVDDYAGLEGRSPALIAGAIVRDHERGRDDATVVVLRNQSM